MSDQADPFSLFLDAAGAQALAFCEGYPVVVIVSITDEDGNRLKQRAFASPRWTPGAELAAVLNARPDDAEERPICRECQGWGHTTAVCETCGGAGSVPWPGETVQHG